MMQLLLSVVQAEDAGFLCERLNARGFRLTRINTVGGFLRRGNVTVLVGVDEEQVPEVLAVIGETCHTRRTFINGAALGAAAGEPTMLHVYPIEVEVGGATTFAFPVRRLVRLQGGASLPATDQAWPSHTVAEGGHPMRLILSIVQNEDADSVTDALIAAGYRATRIATAGGFLRRGNATLLIGVEDDKVDDVLKVIQTSCKPRTEPNPSASGMPMYSATVFVLEASGFWRV